MKKLLFNFFLFSLPLLICLCFFVIGDPFGVLYVKKCLAEASDDVAATRDYLEECDKKKYGAFIFGNSRVHGFRSEDWQKYVGNEAVFHFGAPGESVLNIRKKLEMVLKRQKIRHALILIDGGILENTDNGHRYYQGPVYNHSPLTSDISYLDFYGNYIRYYFTDLFFAKHIYYTLTSDYRPDWMGSSFKDPGSFKAAFESSRYVSLADSLIENDFPAYKRMFRPDYSPFKKTAERVHLKDSLHLCAIKKMLSENKVEYAVVLPPDFSQLKVKPAIKTTLVSVFPDHVFDFTGRNAITTDSTLNFENLHFTTRAGRMMLDSIYGGQPLN